MGSKRVLFGFEMGAVLFIQRCVKFVVQPGVVRVCCNAVLFGSDCLRVGAVVVHIQDLDGHGRAGASDIYVVYDVVHDADDNVSGYFTGF